MRGAARARRLRNSFFSNKTLRLRILLATCFSMWLILYSNQTSSHSGNPQYHRLLILIAYKNKHFSVYYKLYYSPFLRPSPLSGWDLILQLPPPGNGITRIDDYFSSRNAPHRNYKKRPTGDRLNILQWNAQTLSPHNIDNIILHQPSLKVDVLAISELGHRRKIPGASGPGVTLSF